MSKLTFMAGEEDLSDLDTMLGMGPKTTDPGVPLGPVVAASTPLPLGLNIGSTYNHPRDFVRLSCNRQRALLLMLDCLKHSNVELSRSPAEGGAGLEGLRRIRELTGEVWGPFRILKTEDEHGLVWYILDPGSITQRKLDKVFQNRPDEAEPLKLLRARVRKLALTATEGVLHQVEATLVADAEADDGQPSEPSEPSVPSTTLSAAEYHTLLDALDG